MARGRTTFTRGRLGWMLGTVAIFVISYFVGLALENVWLGLLLALIISIGWLIAYESWRGRNVGVNDEDRGIEL